MLNYNTKHELFRLLSEYIELIANYFNDVLIALEQGTSLKQEVIPYNNIKRMVQADNDKIEWYDNATDEEREVTKIVVSDLTKEFVKKSEFYRNEIDKMLRDVIFNGDKIDEDEFYVFGNTKDTPKRFFDKATRFLSIRRASLASFFRRMKWEKLINFANVGIKWCKELKEVFDDMVDNDILEIEDSTKERLNRICEEFECWKPSEF